MGLRSAFLGLLFLWALTGVGWASSGENRCLECHRSHHPEGGACVECHRGNPRTDRPEIAHHELIEGRFAHYTLEGSPVSERGTKRIETAACRRCHATGGKGNRLAVSLDRAPQTSRPQELLEAIRHPVLFMPDFRFSEVQAVEMVNAILLGAAKAPAAVEETPVVVHFEDRGRRKDNPFVKHCGGCHRGLTEGQGGLGQGEVGPNLSGLFSEFYPKTFRDGERWTVDGLKKWLKNPREIRPLATMAPVALKEEELSQLLGVFGEEAERPAP
ncbi:MAG: cytochrome C [Desulfuromonas sp.]|uniref:selenite/tellurite reduction operon c-type cytochrome lipoprotein ExtS n=1 Tax=Desulfuromonas sp. TaxID=892 RepID=UPI000CC76489|nr:selenite/tellurite reduction operon c-type cytochrome lipoprotein ExtS [Desulfuromonas sp.]PLX81738.1 MAG: cytochrome C [Desulfuromonas sp.]